MIEMGNSFYYQRKVLARAMSFKNYLGLGLGSIIGVGWVVVAGDWLVRGGPLGAILGFVLGGVLLTVIGLCYAANPSNTCCWRRSGLCL